MSTNDHTRKPGRFAGQVRRCAHLSAQGRCVTLLHQYHEGQWCHAHEALHMDEPGELRIDAINLPNEAVRELVPLQ